jgi:hypothetical protein
MSTTRKMLLHNRYRRRDQEKGHYVDDWVMWPEVASPLVVGLLVLVPVT